MRLGRFIGVLISAVLLVLTIPAAANAGSGYLGTPGFPLKYQDSSDITLEKQITQVWLHSGFAEVEEVYQFYNNGEAQEFAMGLPDDASDKTAILYGVYNFKGYVNGNEVDVRTVHTNDQEVGGLKGDIDWYVHNVFIPENQRRIVVDRYWIRLDPLRRKLVIPLRPATSWKGNIGEAYYIVHLMGGLSEQNIIYPKTYGEYAGKYSVQPVGFTAGKDELKWAFKNYKPGQDIEVELFGKNENMVSEVKASGSLNENGKEYSPNLVNDKDPATAWAVLNSDMREWLTFSFNDKRWVREFRIIPGYGSLENMYKFYNRPSEITLRFSDGSSQHFSLQDSLDMQYFAVKPVQTKYVKLEIDDAYKGIYSNVTYISEVEFGELASGLKFGPAKWKIGLDQLEALNVKPRYSITDTITIVATILVFLFIAWQVIVAIRGRAVKGRPF